MKRVQWACISFLLFRSHIAQPRPEGSSPASPEDCLASGRDRAVHAGILGSRARVLEPICSLPFKKLHVLKFLSPQLRGHVQGRLAQRESTRFTREGSLVQSQHRPPIEKPWQTVFTLS